MMNIQCSFKCPCCGVQWSSLSLSISVALAVTHQRTSTSLAASRTALTFQCRHPACLDMIYYARSYNSIHSKPKHCLVFSETIHHGRQLLLERGWPSRPECHRFNSHGASQVTCSVTAVGAERINERRDLQWLPKFQLISEGLQYLHCLRYAQMVNKQDEISSWPVPLLWSFWIRLHLQFTSWKVRWLPNRHCHDNLTMVGSRAHFPILYLPVAWRHVKYQTYLHCVPRNIKKTNGLIRLGCLARTSACFLVCQSAVEFKQISRPARTAALVKMHRKAEDKASRISTQTWNSNSWQATKVQAWHQGWQDIIKLRQADSLHFRLVVQWE